MPTLLLHKDALVSCCLVRSTLLSRRLHGLYNTSYIKSHAFSHWRYPPFPPPSPSKSSLTMPGFHAQYRRDAHTTYSTKDLQVQFMGICQQHQLPCLPTPFPLCAGLETNEGYWNYFDDYDYPVQLSVPGGSSYERTVQVDLTVSYTAEKSPRNRNARPYSSWKVKALGADFLLADVRLEGSVLQTEFGLKFVSDGKYLQKALALSSETGYPITIGIVLRGKDRRVGFTVHRPDRAPEVIGYAS